MGYQDKEPTLIKIEHPDVTTLTTQLAEKSKQIDAPIVVNVKDFGAVPNDGTDQTPYIQAAIDHLISLGGGTLFIPSGEYRIVADSNTTTTPTYNPKRLLISGYVTGSEGPPDTRVVHYIENVHIKGDKDTVIYMTGMTFEYLYNQDDISMSNVDIFCAFTFRYAKNCSISNLTIKGDYVYGYMYNGSTKMRYTTGVSQARAKAISIVGCDDIEVYNIKALNILGNFVHVNTAARTLDGYWRPSEGANIHNNYLKNCFEIGIDLTTTVTRAKVSDNVILYANGCGIEGPALINGNTIRYSNGGGISPSADSIVTNNNIQNVVTAFVLTGTQDINNAQHLNTVISNNFVKNIDGQFLNIYANSGNLICKNNKFVNSNLVQDAQIIYNMMVYLSGNPSQLIRNVVISDNYFEINNASSFVDYGIFAASVTNIQITGNTFKTLKTYTSDIYMAELKEHIIKDNNLAVGITQSSTNKERTVINNNIYPSSSFPIDTNWVSATPPNNGSWKVGDIVKTAPVLTPKGSQYNIEFGYECVSTNPLTWRKRVLAEIGEWVNSIPNGGSWSKGRKAFLSAPYAGSNEGWVCTNSGTFGTLNGGATTGSSLANSNALSVNTLSGLSLNNYIYMAGIGIKKVVSTPITLASTTVNASSASGQTVLNVASTTSFQIGDTVAIGFGTANAETGVIASVQSGVSLTLTTNLINTHEISETVTNCVILDSVASTTVSNVAVSFSAPTFEVFGQVGMLTSISSTPSFIGQRAVVSGVGYMAVGTSSTADWKQITN